MTISFATNPNSAVKDIAKPKVKNDNIMKLIDEIKGIRIGKGFSEI
jgi:hypothetical protein